MSSETFCGCSEFVNRLPPFPVSVYFIFQSINFLCTFLRIEEPTSLFTFNILFYRNKETVYSFKFSDHYRSKQFSYPVTYIICNNRTNIFNQFAKPSVKPSRTNLNFKSKGDGVFKIKRGRRVRRGRRKPVYVFIHTCTYKWRHHNHFRLFVGLQVVISLPNLFNTMSIFYVTSNFEYI